MITNRRDFLRASGITLALPWFESLGAAVPATGPSGEARRLLLVCVPLGIYRDAVIPQETGAGYTAPDYLKILDDFRDDFTVISGLDHPGVVGGHSAESRIFTGVPSNQRNMRSLDQYVASKIGHQTRFDTLALSSGRNIFSWTDGGTMVPAEDKMSKVFARLFGSDDKASTEKVLKELKQGRSIMDLVGGQAKRLGGRLSATDRDKLEEYVESVRETERQLVKSEEWVHRPKPEVEAKAPVDPANRAQIVTQLRNVCDMTYLAFKTDSTRVVSFGYFQQNNVEIEGVSNGYHPLSHHGQDPNNIAQLKLIERELFDELHVLLTKLRDTPEGDSNLLERTTIVVTSNLGNGSNHSNKNLPVLLMGGRYNHGQHLAFEPSTVPLSNLYVSVLNQLGIADKTFATATGPLAGLEIG